MPRTPRVDLADHCYHIINRANAKAQIFHNDRDYQLFEHLLEEAQDISDMRILAYCIMPNHWHLVLCPRNDGDLSRFLHWLTVTHTRQWHIQESNIGTGHLYQGRYKSFIIQEDGHLLNVCRYVEKNALRAGLIDRAENWQWSSVWRRERGTTKQQKLLSPWPVETPNDYLDWLNEREDDNQLEAMRLSVNKGKPYGEGSWLENTVAKFKLHSTLRGSGRPRN
jgi:putative transposase